MQVQPVDCGHLSLPAAVAAMKKSLSDLDSCALALQQCMKKADEWSAKEQMLIDKRKYAVDEVTRIQNEVCDTQCCLKLRSFCSTHNNSLDPAEVTFQSIPEHADD